MNTMSRKALAARWGRSTGTIANWSSMGKGPEAHRNYDGTVYYLLSDVIAFENENNMERG